MRPRGRHACLAFAVSLLGCGPAEPRPSETTFFQREISPILTQSCSNSPTQSGCHVAADDRGNALGNLNLSSYDKVSKRPDLLLPFGPYRTPALLVKALPPFQVLVTTWDTSDPIVVRTDIPHGGGALLDVASSSYTQLVRWIERGATENNTLETDEDLRIGRCAEALGDAPLFDASVDPASGDYATFSRDVSPLLGESCATANCHGTQANSLYLTCGESAEQKRWNYFAAADYVATQADSSELLRKPLAQGNGGTYHEGGDIFPSPDAAGYRAILSWAEEKGGPSNVPTDPGFQLFARRVQPMLVKKGCMIVGCHSPAMGHEYRLRGGSGGHFGLPATRRNYELSLEQVALSSPDPNASRLLRKNLVPPVEGGLARPSTALGIVHRGGALFGQGNDACDIDAARTGPLEEQDPYCVIRAWIELEQTERMGGVAPPEAIVYVQRPVATDRDWVQDFETFRPGADLLRAPVTVGADGSLTVGPGDSLLAVCGLSAGVDVRRAALSHDRARLAFSARTAESEPWTVYVIDDTGCAVEPTIAAAPVDDGGEAVPDNGELVHNFDPAFAPDGRIVFTSTRGNVMNRAAFTYDGPQRTPADPSKLNANLYVLEGGRVRQLTFLNNQELSPSFMSDGRIILVTEKRAPDFYQLAGRRINLDGGDYHPLFGQRSTIGFDQLTGVVELADKNLAAIFSERGVARSGGALGIVNRSVGIDQRSDDPADYLQDPAARTWQNPSFFQHSLRIIGGVGRPGEGGRVFRDPSALSDGRVLVSMAEGVADAQAFGESYDVYVVNPISGAVTGPLVSSPDDLLWPVAVFPRYAHEIFRSKLDEPNGATRVASSGGTADVTILDAPLLSSLLFQNTRSRRIVPSDPARIEVWESLPPEPGVTSFAGGGGFSTTDSIGDLYVRRRRLGIARPHDDGSVRFAVPGGMPIMLAAQVELDGESSPTLHHQREEMQFYPGERIRQGFRRDLFNGVCGSCHGTLSGREEDVAVDPDILTQASDVTAISDTPTDLTSPEGAPEGPAFP